MNPGRFYPGKNSKSYGTSIISVNDWSDLWSLEPATEGQEVFINSGISGSPTYGRVLARRTNIKWIVPGANSSTISYLVQHSIPISAPTAPGRKRILGRTTSYDSDLFGGGGNTSAWWKYANDGVQGPTPISYRLRMKNLTGKIIEKITIPFLGHHATPAIISGVWVGYGGSNQDSSNWQRLTFSGQNSYQLAPGTATVPSYVTTDTITLSTPWLPNNEIVINTTFGATGSIPQFDSLGTSQNVLSELSESWIALGDSGSTSDALTATLSWEGGWPVPYCNVFVEFAATESTEVSVLVWGDSVINQFKIFTDTNALYRDNWQYNLETLNTNKKWHVAVGGNGGYDVTQYCQKLNTLLPMYLPWVDVFCVEGWTQNNAPTTMLQANTFKSSIIGTHDLVIAENKAWSVIFPSPTAGIVSGTLNFEAKGQDAITYHDEMINWANTTYPNVVLDVRPGVWDPNNHVNYLAANTVDEIHQTQAGGLAFATYLKPLIDTLLTDMAYEI